MTGTVMQLSRTIMGAALGAALALPAGAVSGDIAPKARPLAEKARSEQAPRARPDGLLVRPDPTVSTKAAPSPRAVIPEITPLERAMARMREGDWGSALRIAGPAGSVTRDIIEWHRLRAGRGEFDEVVDFLARRPDWPGLDYLRKRSEGKVPYRRRTDEVIAFFADMPPQTGAGLIVLAAAQEEGGNAEAARRLAIEAWTMHDLTQADERYLLERYGEVLKDHHEARLDYLLWAGEAEAAERLFPRVSEGWQALARARIALRKKAKGVDTLIEKVPARLAGDPGLAYERFMWRLDKGRRDGAVEILLEREGTRAALGQPAHWGNWRRILARQWMRAGDGKTAYAIASAHGMTPGEGYSYADLEWLSGYLALTYLDDAETALRHFRSFRAAVETPISLGRAGYWEGRAHEALGDAEGAAMAYAFGAEYQTSFYGLLAAERAGLPMDPALTGREVIDDWRLAGFRNSAVFQAAVLMHTAGERDLAERFLTHLAESLTPVEIAQLGDFAIEIEEPHYAVMIGKRAASRGIVVPRAYYPVIDLGLGALPVPEELALAIARRESEFDHTVRSGAGAVGLMQVMPGTARDVARELKISYSKNRLQDDPVYNAQLGVTYLDGLIRTFGENFVLVSAGYNAGPGRPLRWMEERGDPRRGQLDVVDWIERIPFRETRNYVMRVMESLPVYRARLTGETAPIRLSEELTAR
ncbi:lytic transglycosylase domain-containing protein [Ovoidimarina sediminis]|uniref:lytic transglycosylase domain-containing protein n=1 Tax=Ovoidimarina sediminis TaxID=3079856 RepID=UPI00291279F8|nr:lytic transglycosylase domain-containing protein [Rhodophyticola sp. MJ-SS7]MDU8943976.1 lytic transglycosylase domain-containing protein [Rhodophyticola sp. MJ-SS7]